MNISALAALALPKRDALVCRGTCGAQEPGSIQMKCDRLPRNGQDKVVLEGILGWRKNSSSMLREFMPRCTRMPKHGKRIQVVEDFRD